jgi:hypothetical protein
MTAVAMRLFAKKNTSRTKHQTPFQDMPKRHNSYTERNDCEPREEPLAYQYYHTRRPRPNAGNVLCADIHGYPP